jgi:uncharacterized membrane protein
MKNADLVDFLRAKAIALEMEIKNDVSGPVIASFGFIIALVWRDAIKGAVDEFLVRAGLMSEAYIYNFVSAIFVTVVVVAIMIGVTRFSRARKEERIEQNIEKISKKLEK